MENFTYIGNTSTSSSKLKEGVSLLGVFDGHGPNGSDVSGFCRDNISWVLQDCMVKVSLEYLPICIQLN
jgi:serine/threonine protein phosphatase PrpC